jgi:hypothetical protein
MWGQLLEPQDESLSDLIEIAVVTYSAKESECDFLEVEDDLYPRFPGC